MDRASAGRYLTRQRVEDEFDIEAPFPELTSPHPRTSPLGTDLVKWCCFTAAREAELDITAVQLLGPEQHL